MYSPIIGTFIRCHRPAILAGAIRSSTYCRFDRTGLEMTLDLPRGAAHLAHLRPASGPGRRRKQALGHPPRISCVLCVHFILSPDRSSSWQDKLTFGNTLNQSPSRFFQHPVLSKTRSSHNSQERSHTTLPADLSSSRVPRQIQYQSLRRPHFRDGWYREREGGEDNENARTGHVSPA